MKKITHLAFMLTFFTFFVGWSQNTSEPPDFPGTGSGPAINLLVGANTVSGSLATPADGQDRFQVVAPTGTQIDAINFTYNTAGGSSANMTFNSSVVVSSPGGSVSGTPYAAGTYTVLIASGFAISNNWSMSFTVSAVAGCDISIGSVNTAPPSCPGGSDGSITVNATCTTCTAIEYSLDNATFQASNVFIRPAGPYTVFVRDTGDGTCNASAAATVAPGTDTTAPMITCPANMTEDADTTCMFTVPDYTGMATATDNCTTPTVTQNPAPGTMVGLGANTITLTANDGNGQTTDCTFTLTVEDNIAPVITCVADTARDTDAGVCTYTVVGTEFDATFTDNCMSATITNDFNGTATVAGEVFPLGDTVLTWTVDDGNGQTAMCTTTVTVADNEAPTASCAAPFSVQLDDMGMASITVADIDNGSSDNCGVASVTIDRTSFDCSDVESDFALDLSGGVGVGIATDANATIPIGNAARTLSVRINPTSITSTIGGIMHQGNNDCTGRMFGMGSSNTGQMTFWGGCNDYTSNLMITPGVWQTLTLVYDGAGTVTLYKDGLSENYASGALITEAGRLFVGVESINNGASYRNFFDGQYSDVKVFDRALTPAEVMMLASGDVVAAGNLVLDIPIDEGSGTALADVAGSNNATAFGTDDSDWVEIAQSQSVTLTVTDVNGNVSTCTTQVTVEDNIAPVITCVADAPRDTDAGVCTYTVVGTEFDATFTDNCTSATITNDFNGTATVAGEVFPLGDTVLTWTVDDGNGQTAMCTTTVTVEDNEAPMITCVADAPRDTDAGVCTYTVVGTEFDATFTDNCMSATITNDFNGTATVAGEVFPLGDTVLTWTVDDGNGQTAMCTTTVTVEDNEAPVITCVADAPRDTDAGVCTYTVVGTEFDATFTDNCMSATITNDFNGTATVAGEVFPLGDTVLTWTVDDGNGQTAMCTTTVTVEDNEAPVITCVADAPRDTDAGVCTYTVVGTEFDATFTDNCMSATITNDFNGTATVAGEVFPLGDTVLTWTVDDGNGQTAMCTTTVTVEDNEAPMITCVADAPRDTDAGVCTYTVVGTEFDATFTDNCMSATITNDFNGTATVAGEVFPLGDTVLTWTVDDGNGQTAMCTTTVTVEDNEAPMITCVADAPRDTDAGVCTYTVVGTEFDATFTDNCMSATITNDFNGTATVAGEVFPLGDTVLTWTVDDNNGQTDTCMMTITVVDVTPVTVISGPVDIFTGTGTLDEACATIVDYGTITIDSFEVEDNCSDAAAVIVTQTAGLGSGSMFPVGTTVEEFTLTDENGNETVYTFEVTVADTTLPVIDCPDDIIVSGDDSGNYTIEDYTGLASDNCSSGADLVVTQDPMAGTVVADPSTTTITLTAIDAAGNEQTCSFELIVDETLSIGDEALQNIGVAMYPNPASSQVTLDAGIHTIDTVTVYDLAGREVVKEAVRAAAYQLDVSNFSTAVYFVQIQSGDTIITKRLIKE